MLLATDRGASAPASCFAYTLREAGEALPSLAKGAALQNDPLKGGSS